MARDAASRPLFDGYRPLAGTWDEYFEAAGRPRAAAAPIVELLERLGRKEFRSRQKLADATFLRGGITFSVYSDSRGAERIFPFDLIPRVIAHAAVGSGSRAGLEQRVRALNAFLDRRLRRPAHPRRGGRSRATSSLGAEGLPARDAGHPAARRRLRPHRRHRPDPRTRRRVPGARGQRAHAVRRLLRAREPHGHEEGLPARLLASRTVRGRRGVSAAAARGAGLGRSGAGRRGAARSCSRPGPSTRPTSSTASWRGAWACRSSRAAISSSSDDRVYAKTTLGPAPHRRDLPAHRRRLPRPRGLPQGQHARRAGPGARLRDGQRRARQRRSATASPTTRASTPSCPT